MFGAHKPVLARRLESLGTQIELEPLGTARRRIGGFVARLGPSFSWLRPLETKRYQGAEHRPPTTNAGPTKSG